MKQRIHYRELEGGIGFWVLLAGFGVLIALGLASVHYMETYGHWVTGMTNQVVWGIPHVFAVFLIVAASGVLNTASVASVFARTPYKPLAPLSGLLSITLLIGGLAVLVLDLGHSDRILVAMTHYNFRSIFAWNIFLYIGFMLVVAIYLWFNMERRMNRYIRPVGFVAFVWRITLTTGTGSIFGFLIARDAYDSALMGPMFVIMSFSFGLAIYILVLMSSYAGSGRPLGDATLRRLKNLLGVFIAAVLYFLAIFHLTNLYWAQHVGVEEFILFGGNVYTWLFWGGQVLLGGLVPLALLYSPATGNSRFWIAVSSVLVILGGLALVYVIIIGGQAYPLDLFPGKAVSSTFYDGVINTYTPSLPEILLGISGIAISLAATMVAIKFLPFLPVSLKDEVVEPPATPPAPATAEAHA
ncbi:polysulfide reductase, NrfD [bacterium BMS3Bbin12]|nr:polysulfide reductase, NrfD [bacterium BMS3Bbin12]GBE50844.1 polysulfide reductase, NrfD [bacterium BMS3Bbin13]HDK02612.1 molybdopterin oxidoreductase [Gammaproteobacteria bacterium]